MSHFYGTMKGNRGTVSRCGGKDSGLEANVRGWNTGCIVKLTHKGGKDIVTVWRTFGTNGRKTEQLIAAWDYDHIILTCGAY